MSAYQIESITSPQGEIEGVDYRTGQWTRVRWAHSEICDVTPGAAPVKPHEQRWIAPTLLDVQVNGYGGIDFQQDDLTSDQLLSAARALRSHGCARFFLTLITAEWPTVMQRLRRARDLRNASAELRAAIAGWHVEGPFLSEKPGYCGAHDPAAMLDPTVDHIRELRRNVGSDRVLLTLAPERTGALEAIAAAVSLGITISLGHTDASAETLRAAVAAGATGFTHLGNGCPRDLDRHDNIIWRACDTAGLTVSLIPDGIHLPPATFRGLHRLQGPIYYTTDAMAAAGAIPGRYRIGRLEVEVGSDQVVRQPGQSNFAGSALQPAQAVFRAAEMLNRPWQECWHRLSHVPADFAGVVNTVAPRQPADFCVITAGS